MFETETLRDAKYTRTVLFETEAFEVVRCVWQKEAISMLHSHGVSQCSVLIENGIFENKTVLGFKTETQILKVGQFFTTPIAAEHEIKCISETGTTLHVYSPKISKDLKPATFHNQNDKLEFHLDLGDSLNWNHVSHLLSEIEKSSVTTSSPYFMNQLFSGVHSQTLAAESVIHRTRTTLATWEASPVYSLIEKEITKKLAMKMGWDSKNSDGIGISGGSAANMMALHCARHSNNPLAKTQGNQNHSYRIYVSDQAHYSFLKSANAIGLGTNSVVSIQTDEFGKMISDDLQAQIQQDLKSGHEPLLVAATAGTTVLGAFDPIDELAVVARKFNLWLHVDAAWGAPAYFSKNTDLIKGSELADSLTFDAHKFFGADLTSTFFVVKNGALLFEANDVKGGEYLFHESEELDRGRLSWQCGRGAEFLSFWTLWKNLGDQGLQNAIDQKLELVQTTVDFIKNQQRLRLISHPSFLNLCVQVLPPQGSEADPRAWSIHVRKQMIKHHQAMVNYSENSKDGAFLRMIFVHPQLNFEHVKNILNFALGVC